MRIITGSKRGKKLVTLEAVSYTHLTTGQEVLAAYGEAESVLRLVENTFTSALGKLLVGAAAGGVGLWGLRGSRPKDQK